VREMMGREGRGVKGRGEEREGEGGGMEGQGRGDVAYSFQGGMDAPVLKVMFLPDTF
jgi:hypothetical protein